MKMFELEKKLAEQIRKTDELNQKLMDAVMNGATGTQKLERKAESSAKAEEDLKKDLAAAKAELAEVAYNATQQLKADDAKKEAKLDAFFAAIPRANGKKLKKAKRDVAADRNVRRELDGERYIAWCSRQQEAMDLAAEQKRRKEEKAAKIAEEKRLAAEKAAMKEEAEPEIALGETPEGAYEAVVRLDRAKSLLGTLKTEIEDLRAKRDDKLTELVHLQKEIETISAALKAPQKSAKVRMKQAAAKLLETEVSDLSAEMKADRRIMNEVYLEIRSLKEHLRILRLYGNAAVRPTVRMTEQQLREKRVKIQEVIRELATVEEKVLKDSFQIPAFDRDYFQEAAGLDVLFAQVNKYSSPMLTSEERQEAKTDALKAIKKLNKMVEERKPIRLKIDYSRPSRIQLNFLAMAMTIDTEDKGVRTEWINVEHGIQESLRPSWKLFAGKKEDGEELASKFVESVFELLDNIVLIDRDGVETVYHGLYSSASHQKKEKLVLCRENLLELHEDIVWFGKTKAEVLKTTATGAEIWKARANLARPIAFAIKTADGQNVYLHNVMMVPDVKKTYHHENAVRIGVKGNLPYAFGPCDNPVVVCDGGTFSKVKLNSDGWQGGGAGYKTMCIYAHKAFELAGVDLPEGKLLVCGDGCFKFDKFGYANWDEFAARMDELAKRYPGINQVYALRQSEELEDEERIRKVSRSLLQQIGLVASNDELHKLVDPAIDSLNRMKTFEGLFTSLAELNIPADKRSDFAKLIFACPELLTNANVQAIAKARWDARRNECAGNKFRTKGQYPYIMQDPVAVLQIWLGGRDVNDPDLGVLKAGEASLVGLPEGAKVGALRYPANALTVKILVNRVLKDIFGECGNVAILSIHDDILIYQDGDVDGDEQGILYDKLIIELIERMHKILKPYVIVFEHGSKADRIFIADAAAKKTDENAKKARLEAARTGKPVKPIVVTPEDELRQRMYGSLYAAKKFDNVGPYANLARDCVYLANIELKELRKARKAGNNQEADVHTAECHKFLLWMAAASTGAIMAIDQVKGNDVNLKLIGWLDAIKSAVHNDRRMQVVVGYDELGEPTYRYAQPATQPYVKEDFTITARPINSQVCTDEICGYVLEKAGEYSHDGQGFVKNDAMLRNVLLDQRHPLAVVRKAPVTQGVLTELRANYFNRPLKGEKVEEINPDKPLFELIRRGEPVGQRDLLLMYWRNQCTLEFRTQVKTASERKALYYKMVHDSLIAQALSQPWFCEKAGGAYEVGHEFSNEEKIACVVGEAVLVALEIGRKNGLNAESKGSFAKFVLSVFAKELLENIQRNSVDIRHFMQENYVVVPEEEDGYEATDFSLLNEAGDEPAYDYYEDEDASVLDDGSIDLGSSDEEPPIDYFPEECTC